MWLNLKGAIMENVPTNEKRPSLTDIKICQKSLVNNMDIVKRKINIV